MKKIFAVAVLLCAQFVFAQTTTFTANLKDLATNTPATPEAGPVYIELTLKNCAGSGTNPTLPRVNGVGVVSFPVNLYPVSGVVTATVYDETFIVCGASVGVGYYHIRIYQGDNTRSLVKKLVFEDDFDISGASFSLNSAAPRSGAVITPPPATAVLTNPSGAQTVTQPALTSLTINRLSAGFAQSANGTDMIPGNRFTDTAPTGNFINFKNAALSSTLFGVDVLGNAIATSVSLGATPSLTGAVRLPNSGGSISWRNSGNTADFTGISASGNTLNIGFNSEINTNGGVTFSSASASRFTMMTGGTSILSGRSDGAIGFSSTTSPGTNDSAISRGGAAKTIAVGNGTAGDASGTLKAAVFIAGVNTVAFSATPTFDCSLGSVQKLTLTANVTSSTLSNCVAAQFINFEICQNATGGFTFVAPTNVLSFSAPPTAANACIMESFIYDGTNAMADEAAASQVLAQDGSAGAPSIAFENSTGTGFFRNGSSIVQAAAGAADASFSFAAHGQFVERSDGIIGFSSTTTQPAAADAAISRVSAGVIGCGTGASGNTAGECDMRTLGITGSTSGKTSLITDATASGSPTLKAGTYNIVGDSLTQTLTGKNLQSAGNGNAVTLLNGQGVQTNVTGNSTDQTLFTFTIPANTIGAGKGIRVKTCIKNNNAVAVTQKFFFGATSFTMTSSASSGISQCYTVDVVNNPASQTGQVWNVLVIDGATISVINADVTSAENTANAVIVKITGNEVSPNTVAPRMWTVELIQ